MKTTVFILAAFLTGCITTAYHKSNEEYAHVFREFDMSETGESVHKGRDGGVQEIGGVTYHRLQFDNRLRGPERYLEILLPANPNAGARSGAAPVFLRESSELITSSIPCYLVLQTTAGRDLESFYAFFRLATGQESDPAETMKKQFQYSIDQSSRVSLVRLDFAMNYVYSTNAAHWQSMQSKRVSAVWIDSDAYNSPRLAIEWRERSKFLYGLRQFGYAGTVLADVVTSPVQLAGAILLLAAGPGAK